MKIVNVEEIEDRVERVAEIGIHAVFFFNLVQIDQIFPILNQGVDFVMSWFVLAVCVFLKENGSPRKYVSYAEQVDFAVEVTTHAKIIRNIIIRLRQLSSSMNYLILFATNYYLFV